MRNEETIMTNGVHWFMEMVGFSDLVRCELGPQRACIPLGPFYARLALLFALLFEVHLFY